MTEMHKQLDPLALLTLTVKPGSIIPSLWGGRTEFAVALPHGVDHLSVTAKAAVPGVSMDVAGQPLGAEGVSEPVAAPPGLSMLTVRVTAPDGATRRDYRLKIHRALPVPNWRKLADTAPWAARDSAGELVFNGRMWIFGGYLPELVSDVWSSADGIEWHRTGEIPSPAGINIPVTFAHAGRMWVSCNDGQFFSSPDGAAWDLAAAKTPWGYRYAAGCAVFNDRMWVLGGAGEGRFWNDVWSSTDGVRWTCECARAPWSPRQVFGNLVVHDGKLWLIGGGITAYQPFKAYRDVWCSPDGRTWDKVTDEAPWPARIWSSCAVYRDRIWLVGGFRSQPSWNNFNDLWYSADGARWEPLATDDIWEPRHEISVYAHAGRLWVIGGNAWPLKNDVWSLSIPGLVFLSQPSFEEFFQAEYRYRARADFNRGRGPIRYRLVEAPDWLRCDAATGVVRGVVPAIGDYRISIEAYDDAGETARQDYTLHAIPAG